MIRDWAFKKNIIQNSENTGIAAANNQGIKFALKNQCDFILLLNNDTVFEATLLSKLIKTAQLYSCSAVAPKMNYFRPSDKIWYAGGFFNPFKAFLNYHRGQDEIDNNQYSTDDVVDYAPSCCLLLHKKVFEDIGLMDETYFVYFDDTDFCYRLSHHPNHEIRYLHDVEFYHKIGSLTKSRVKHTSHYSSFFIQQNCKNHVYFLKKHKASFFLYYLWVYVTLRFFISHRFPKNWKTFLLIQTSYFRGLKM